LHVFHQQADVVLLRHEVLVQGITGSTALFHTKEMLEYGTKIVGGVTPGRGGQTAEGVPVFNTVKEAVEATDANATVIFVPAKFTAPGVYEAMDAGVKLVLTIAEHVPVHDMMNVYHRAKKMGVRVIGPNSFGVIDHNSSHGWNSILFIQFLGFILH